MGKSSEDRNQAITRREWLAGAAAAGISMLAPRAMGADTAAGAGQTMGKPEGTMPSVSGAAKLNVVYIVADDLGWADVGYHRLSEIRTPHIDKLVSEGVELDRFYGCPVCSPSRACLLTGRSPMRYGMIYEVVRPWQTHGVPQEERLMSEAFRDAGYQTWAVGKWHLGLWNRKLVPNGRGFDHYYGFLTGEIEYFQHTREDSLDWQRNGTSVREPGYSTDLLAAEAARLIEQRDRAKPFFLYLPFNAPHQPLMAPDDLIRSYAAIEDQQRRTYAAMVTSLDAGMGRVKEALDRSGAGGNTLIVFHSDNGGQTKKGAVNHPLRAGKSTVFEGGIRVPAFLHAPGLLPAARTSQQVLTNLDMFPTLAAATGVEPGNRQPFDGRDLWHALAAGQITEREDLFFAIGERDVWQHAVFHGPWKLVLEKKQAEFRLNPADPPEKALLFRIAEDPYEKDDVSGGHADVVADLTARVRAWCALHPRGDIGLSSERHPGFIAPEEWADCALR